MSSTVFVLVLGITGIFGEFLSPGKAGRNDNTTNQVCYGNMGCFDLGEPWSREGRVPRPQEPRSETVIVHYYSRENTEKTYVFKTYPDIDIREVNFDGSLPTAVIIHDYGQDVTWEWVQTIKYFYILNHKSNVLLVDYSKACKELFVRCVSNARVVGKLVERLLNYLMDERNLDPKMIHFIGHGLGAHIASYIAKKIDGISRITALDPQQEFFEYHNVEIRLDKTDAEFVEVVHTNARPKKGNGMIRPHGHVDFYFNDGGNQPGCLLPPGLPEINTYIDLIRIFTNYRKLKELCSHNRAYDYLVESYNSLADCVFWGLKVSPPPVPDSTFRTMWKTFLSYLGFDFLLASKSPPCTEDECIPFGYQTIKSPLRGVFVVETNKNPPYCKPKPGPLLEE